MAEEQQRSQCGLWGKTNVKRWGTEDCMGPNHTVLADFLRDLAFTQSERKISHWRVWCTEMTWLDACLKRRLIILLEIFWRGRVEQWVESYCNNQGRADDTFSWAFCLDIVLSLLPFTFEVSWVQTWVEKVEVSHTPCVLSLNVEPWAPGRVCTHSLNIPVPKKVWH